MNLRALLSLAAVAVGSLLFPAPARAVGSPPVVTVSTSVSHIRPSGGGLVNVGLSVTVDDASATKTVEVWSNDPNLTGTGTAFVYGGFYYYPKPAAAQLVGSALLLRADRYATPGRVYLVIVKATNADGTGFACRTVVVPWSGAYLTPPASITGPAASAKAYCDANAGAPPPGAPIPSGTGYDVHLSATTLP